MKVILSENFRAVFYAPFYACLTLGFFRQRGLDVSLVASPSPGAGIADMIKGSTHVVWGGPLRALKDRDTQPAGPHSLVAFGEVAARDPFYLVGRTTLQPFNLTQLLQLKMASVSEVVTPWLCLQHDLRELGIDPDMVGRSDDSTMAANLSRLADGSVDVAQIFEPYVTLAERKGIGVPLHAAHRRGPTAYTTFLSTAENIARYEFEFRAMGDAIESFMPWLESEGVSGLTRVVEPFYPALERSVIEQSLARYHSAGIWACRSRVSRLGFQRLAQSMLSGGYIQRITPYEECVATWAQQPV